MLNQHCKQTFLSWDLSIRLSLILTRSIKLESPAKIHDGIHMAVSDHVHVILSVLLPRRPHLNDMFTCHPGRTMGYVSECKQNDDKEL
jgi:hypothetical protein